jgi:ABC-type polar amino acid transport system ATPase subunit
VISVRTLCKRHGARAVLENVSAEVSRGETIAIVGPSGGGKSTLLRCMNYLESFDEGEIEICGTRLVPRMGRNDAATLRALRVRVGMVFQQFNLFPHLSALDNITLAPRVVRKADRVRSEERARELLDKVHLADRAGAFPHELSGGQQQRVAIARALAQEPEVMLFDEPTSALDPEMRDDVMEVIRDLAKGGMTMLVVTHEMQFAHDIASRVWVIDRGGIAEDGPPSRVVDDPETDVAREFFSRIRRRPSAAAIMVDKPIEKSGES